jgi:hypothetical protein
MAGQERVVRSSVSGFGSNPRVSEEKEMKKIVALFAVAAATAAFAAPNTQLCTEVSVDNGATWAPAASVSVNTAGARVTALVRTSVRYVQNDGPVTNLLQSARHQPLVSNLIAADSVLAFNATGKAAFNAADGFQAADFGRLFGATTVGAVLAHRPTVDAVHFAEAAGTDRPGIGNNAAGNRGVNTAGNPIADPLFTTTDFLPLFIFGLELTAPSVLNTNRTVNITVPVDGLRRNQAGQRSFAWLSSRSPLVAQEAAAIAAFCNGAVTISYVPAPGAAALLGLGGLVAGRRRR